MRTREQRVFGPFSFVWFSGWNKGGSCFSIVCVQKALADCKKLALESKQQFGMLLIWCLHK